MAAKEEKDLQDIKRLLMLLLIKLGTTSEEIGLALGTDSSVVRRSLPMRRIKTLTLTK